MTPMAGTPERRRQLRLLVVLAVVVVAAVWYQFGSGPAAPSSATSNPTARRTDGPAAAPDTLPEGVRLGELAKVPDNAEVGRNPFGYGLRPAPPPPPPVARPIPPPVVLPPPVPQGPPPIALKLTGLTVVPETKRTMVTLKDATGTLFQAFEGDIVDGRYRIVRVGVQSVVVAYVDGTGQRTIPLGG